mmetsp:Transcript_18139/g.36797  ORF Transcript_18139/g.36797 Transcript_18139/m.36797 type:complete len:94 (-) Transcript_18139:412-693(-)
MSSTDGKEGRSSQKHEKEKTSESDLSPLPSLLPLTPPPDFPTQRERLERHAFPARMQGEILPAACAQERLHGQAPYCKRYPAIKRVNPKAKPP